MVSCKMGVRRTRFLLIQYRCWGDCAAAFLHAPPEGGETPPPSTTRRRLVPGSCNPPKIAFQNVHGDFLPFKSWAVRFRPPAPDKARHTSCLWLRAKSRDFYMREPGDGAVAAKSVRAVRLRPSATIVAGSPATRAKAPKKAEACAATGQPGTYTGY